MRHLVIIMAAYIIVVSCRKNAGDPNKDIIIDSVFVNQQYLPENKTIYDIDYKKTELEIRFGQQVDTSRFIKDKIIITGGRGNSYSYNFDHSLKKLFIVPDGTLTPLSVYRLSVESGSNLGGTMTDHQYSFITSLDSTPKFPLISDDSLLTLVQKQTFRYFWDYAHPVSGLSRERLGSGDLVTSGGSGFGLMAIIVGIERKFISRPEGFERLKKIVYFLNNPATDRFHGIFPHWMNGASGKVIPFSQKDNGGDLVETSYLMQGLLTVREYFRNGSPPEIAVCDTIEKLWERVEWDWYRNNQNKLFWHWSPSYNWDMNMPVTGWNEALIAYILAASSPSHGIPPTVYDEGWARNGAIRNGKSYYGITLPLGEDYGGPLFFAHYSFLGLDPRNLSDKYANYMDQNISHSLINYRYCIDNPKKWRGYSSSCWGLTASDTQLGYSASSPGNDIGVIAPTAAISSIPYTPGESLRALRFFYYVLGDRLWGEYGFHDAFNITALWFANSYLAIDQGPIICMIENYNTGILWKLFMVNPDIQTGLKKLGFTF